MRNSLEANKEKRISSRACRDGKRREKKNKEPVVKKWLKSVWVIKKQDIKMKLKHFREAQHSRDES